MSDTPKVMCRDRGFAGPTCCVLEKGHAGEHRYGYPKISTREEQLEAELAATKELIPQQHHEPRIPATTDWWGVAMRLKRELATTQSRLAEIEKASELPKTPSHMTSRGLVVHLDFVEKLRTCSLHLAAENLRLQGAMRKAGVI